MTAMSGFMSITTNLQARFNAARKETAMKLKDKKIEILENKVTVDRIGNHVSQLVPFATVWAYFQ